MKYNTTYSPKTSLKETIIETNLVIQKVKKYFHNKFELISVISPLFLEEDSELLINIDSITRPLTFDFGDEYKTAQLFLTNSNWLRKIIKVLDLKNNEGLITEESTIWRDLPDTPISTIGKNEITVQIRIDNKSELQKIVRNEAQEFYSFLEILENDISKKYNLKKIWPEFAEFVSAQSLENEYPNLNKKEREIDIAHELNCYIFEKPSKKLFSGHRHTILPDEIYNQNNFYQIVCKDFINTSVLKIASISELASGITLDDQLKLNNKEDLKQLNFYSNLIKNDEKIIEFKINISKLMFALMKKGHISEIQAGVISNESTVISSRYKVEKY